jgi:hypothetical protein
MPPQAFRLEILPGHDEHHAGRLERGACVDGADARVRVRRHDDRAVQHVRQLQVVDVARAAGEEALVLDAAHGLANSITVHRGGFHLLRFQGEHVGPIDVRPILSRLYLAVQKSALVTGGATGIGRSAVLALARAGSMLPSITARAKPRRAKRRRGEKLGARTLLVRCDVSDEKGVRAMLRAVEEKFQRLDVLVNNAGTTAAWKPRDLETLSLEDWDRVFAVNVRGSSRSRAPRTALKKARAAS